MTIVQFINAMNRYSVDVLALALLVCLLTSVVKKVVPQSYKKYITFVPFILGILVFAGSMYLNKAALQEIFSCSTALKGLECGAAATIYYVLYEQFIRGKTSLAGLAGSKEMAVAGILSEYVEQNKLAGLSKYIAQNVTANADDTAYCVSLTVSALSGKTKPGITDSDIYAAAQLIVKALSVMK